ncbi:hypothetical protein DdX_18133 [Ditylenchus destructor]|uniref:Uncharacterized protein n=1 Tax=Ditylenchus destructor TaxID=166010 RepID=A0AAD4QT07_9BILA|nr:hypothetical protein DdX_18133 [Ditylenchus destructor]
MFFPMRTVIIPFALLLISAYVAAEEPEGMVNCEYIGRGTPAHGCICRFNKLYDVISGTSATVICRTQNNSSGYKVEGDVTYFQLTKDECPAPHLWCRRKYCWNLSCDHNQ